MTAPETDLSNPERVAAALLVHGLDHAGAPEHDRPGIQRLAAWIGSNGGDLPAVAAHLAATAAALIQPGIDAGATTADEVKQLIRDELGRPADLDPDETP